MRASSFVLGEFETKWETVEFVAFLHGMSNNTTMLQVGLSLRRNYGLPNRDGEEETTDLLINAVKV